MSDPLSEYIRCHAPQLVGVTDDTELLKCDLLDSLDLMKLIAFLERRYRLVVPDDAITPQNFATLAAIRTLINGLASVG